MTSGSGDRVPVWAAGLGYSGAVPFAAAAIAAVTGGAEIAAVARTLLLTYGAVILSFLGGVHWGLAMLQGAALNVRLVIGVLPSLIGWAALLLGGRAGLLLLAAAVATLAAFDLWAARRGWTASWYPRLRLPLSIIVTLSLVMGSFKAG